MVATEEVLFSSDTVFGFHCPSQVGTLVKPWLLQALGRSLHGWAAAPIAREGAFQKWAQGWSGTSLPHIPRNSGVESLCNSDTERNEKVPHNLKLPTTTPCLCCCAGVPVAAILLYWKHCSLLLYRIIKGSFLLCFCSICCFSHDVGVIVPFIKGFWAWAEPGPCEVGICQALAPAWSSGRWRQCPCLTGHRLPLHPFLLEMLGWCLWLNFSILTIIFI